MMMLLREVGGNSVPKEYGHYSPLARALAFSYYFGFYLLKINQDISRQERYDTFDKIPRIFPRRVHRVFSA